MARKDENDLMLKAQIEAALRHADELLTTPGTKIVSLERYPRTATSPAQYGIHIMAPGNLLGADPDWGHFTMGLYHEDDMEMVWEAFVRKYGVRETATAHGELSEDVRGYIRDRIIPLEWKGFDDDALGRLVSVTEVEVKPEQLPAAKIKDASPEETNEFFGVLTDRGTVLFNRSVWVCKLPDPDIKLYVDVEVFHGNYDVSRMRNAGWFIQSLLTLTSFNIEQEEGYGISGDEVLHAYMSDLEDARGRVLAGGYSYGEFLAMARMMATSINSEVAHIAAHLVRNVLEETL